MGLAFYRDPLQLFLDLARQYGDIVGTRLGHAHFVLLSHPDLVESVLVQHPRDFIKEHGHAQQLVGKGLLVSEGDFHMRQRRLMQPAFHRDRVAGYGSVMADFSRRLSERWQRGASVDIYHEMMHLAQVIAGKTLFDADVEADVDAVGEAIATALHTNFLLQQIPFARLFAGLSRRTKARYDEAIALVNRTFSRLIAERRKDKTDRGDLLSMLLKVQDAEGGTGGLTDEQIRDELVTLFVAGHETTGGTMTWTWHMLARHPEVEAQLHEELDRVLGGRPPTVADVPRLVYTEMLIAEVLRMWPSAWTQLRQTVHETQVGGYTLPADTYLFLSSWVIHHDPRFFPDPWRFDPARMTHEARHARPRFAYFPFGGGSRQCIGESYAWMEMIVVIATIAQRWRLRLAPGQKVVPNPGATLRPKEGVRMILESRN
jgi:cytochrome P450